MPTPTNFHDIPKPDSTAEGIANWRAQAVLSIAGFLPAVDSALDALSEPAKTVGLAVLEWRG